MKKTNIPSKFCSLLILIVFLLLGFQKNAKAYWPDELYAIASSGKPMVLFPDSLYSQVNTMSFTIRIYQTQRLDEKPQQLIYIRYFVKLTNPNYFTLMGAVTLNGIPYHVYQFIDDSYNINAGYYAYISILETYGYNKVSTYDRIKPCTDYEPACASRSALYFRYEIYYSPFVNELPYENLDATSKSGIGQLMNWSQEYTGNQPGVSFWEDVLNPAALANSLPVPFECNNMQSMCACAFNDILPMLDDIGEIISDTNMDLSASSSTVSNAFNELKVNSMTDCNCLSKYYPLDINYSSTPDSFLLILLPKEDHYPPLLWASYGGSHKLYVLNGFSFSDTTYSEFELRDTVNYEQLRTKIISSYGDNAICSGEADTLTITGLGSNSDSFLWNNGDSTVSIVITPDSTTIYTASMVLAGGCTINVSFRRTVVPSPEAEAGENDTICPGDTATLTATGGAVYHWSTSDTTASISVAPDSTTVYFVTVTDTINPKCQAIDSVTVFVKTIPEAEAGPDDTICKGVADTLTASEGTSYLWSTTETTVSIIVVPDSTTMYMVTVSNGCFSANDSVTITVNEQPLAEISASRDTICAGTADTITAGGGTSYKWSNNETTEKIVVSTTATSIFYVSVYNDNGCYSKDSVKIHVNPLPTAEAGANISLCTGMSDTITATGGIQYLWSTSDTTASIFMTPDSTTTYFVSVTNSYGCMAYDSAIVTVNAYAVANAGNDISICKGKTDTLTASGGNGYLWSNSATTASIAVSPDSTTTFWVTVSNNGCPDTASVTVTVNPLPMADAGSNDTICIGDTTTLTATGNGTFYWSIGDSSTSIAVNPIATTNYTVTVTNTYGCTATDNATVTVNPLPNADAGFNKSIALGDTATLNASGGTHYHWDTGDSTANINVYPSTATIYYVTVTDVHGCSAIDDVTVLVGDSLSPYAENYWHKNDSIIATIAGVSKVGIGTDNPTEKLSVAGNMLVDGKLIVKRISTLDSVLYLFDSTIVFQGAWNPGNQTYSGYKLWTTQSGNPSIYSGFGIGTATDAMHPHSCAIGYNAKASNDNSIALGTYVSVTGLHSVVIGSGLGSGLNQVLNNNIDNSLMVGFKSPNPTLFVDQSNIGIGTKLPQCKLTVIGEGRFYYDDVFNDPRYVAIFHSGSNGEIKNVGTGNLLINYDNGKEVHIGTASQQGGQTANVYMGKDLYVCGRVKAKEVLVELNCSQPDYIFEDNYKMMNLTELEKYIKTNKHLPEVPSASEVEKNGIKLGEMNTIHLKKIEELTLYIIEINKRLESLEKENVELIQQIKILENSK